MNKPKIRVTLKMKAPDPPTATPAPPVEAKPEAPPGPPPKLVKLPAVGGEVTIVKLTNLYDQYATAVLGDRLKQTQREKKGAIRRFTVTKPLPQPSAYAALKAKRYMTTIEALVADGFQAIEEVAGEVREWFDNLPDGLQQGDRGSRLDEAASALENLQAPDVPGGVLDVPVAHYPSLKAESRQARVAEGASMLRAVIDALNGDDKQTECEDCGGAGTTDCETCSSTVDCVTCQGTGKVDSEEVDNFISELENAADEAEGVEIPGMYD